MKIHNVSKYVNYNGTAKPIKHDEETIKSKNYDVIEINKSKIAQGKSNVNLEKIKKDIAMEINKETNCEKIEAIRESIKNNSYQVDVDKLVKKLLDK